MDGSLRCSPPTRSLLREVKGKEAMSAARVMGSVRYRKDKIYPFVESLD
jgi:hypothetical protein